MNQEKIKPAYEPGTKFFRWLDNFWYHYKWAVIFTVFILVTVIVCSVQFFSREEPDMYILYAGPYKFGQTDTRSMERVFSSIVTDRNGDGKAFAQLADYYILSDEQITGELEKAKANHEAVAINYEMFANNREAFDQQIMAGEMVICLLDPYLYADVHVLDDDGNKVSGFMPLSEVLGYTPEYAVDDYAVRIGDTPLGQYSEMLQKLDEDTLLCIRKMSSFAFLQGKKRTEKHHAYCREVFCEIFAYVPPTAEE